MSGQLPSACVFCFGPATVLGLWLLSDEEAERQGRERGAMTLYAICERHWEDGFDETHAEEAQRRLMELKRLARQQKGNVN